MINNRQKHQNNHSRVRLRALPALPVLPSFFLSLLLLSVLLLSACSSPISGGTPTAGNPTPLPKPAVDPTLQKQGDTQLQTFQQWIALMQKYNGDVTTYQQQYTGDQQALHTAKSSSQYTAALTTLNTHVEAIKLPAMKAEAQGLLQQLNQQVTSWGKQHQYHDTFNNQTYPLGYEYGSNGIASTEWAQGDLNNAKTIADYQQSIENLNMWITNFQAFMKNSSDKTSYSKVHQSDLDLLQHYNMMNSKVVVISLSEQALRVYQNGKLIKSFLVTTGRPDKPSVPGTWWVEGKKSPTVFKADVPKSSPYWYPDTPINYAMQYHSNGYFLHDSWWRNDYGPGTNYPHADSSGDPFSAQGSHGCVNMSKDDANWLYNFVVVYTHIVMY